MINDKRLLLDSLIEKHSEFNENEIILLHTMIASFIQVFGRDEYINLHNKYMLPLINERKEKNVKTH